MDEIIASICMSTITDSYIIPIYENEKEIEMEDIEKVLALSWEY